MQDKYFVIVAEGCPMDPGHAIPIGFLGPFDSKAEAFKIEAEIRRDKRLLFASVRKGPGIDEQYITNS